MGVKRTAVLLFLLALVVGLPVVTPAQRRPIVLAFVPSLDAQRVLATGRVLERMLEVATGMEFEATVPTSYAATIEAMCADRADVAFLAPLSYVLAHERCGAQVQLISIRNNLPYYGSQILVHAESGLRQLLDLRAKRFAFVDPASASGYLYPALHIKRRTGLLPERFFAQVIFAGGHDKVVLAVYQRQVEGGATFGDELGTGDARERVLRQFPDVKQKVVVLEYVKPYIPNDTVSVRRGMEPEMTRKVVRALKRIAETQSGKQALQDLYQIDGFADYEDLVTKYKVNRREVPSLDAYFNPIRQAARELGVDLGKLVR